MGKKPFYYEAKPQQPNDERSRQWRQDNFLNVYLPKLMKHFKAEWNPRFAKAYIETEKFGLIHFYPKMNKIVFWKKIGESDVVQERYNGFDWMDKNLLKNL